MLLVVLNLNLLSELLHPSNRWRHHLLNHLTLPQVKREPVWSISVLGGVELPMLSHIHTLFQKSKLLLNCQLHVLIRAAWLL